jgi:hypothetical protein
VPSRSASVLKRSGAPSASLSRSGVSVGGVTCSTAPGASETGGVRGSDSNR